MEAGGSRGFNLSYSIAISKVVMDWEGFKIISDKADGSF